MNEMNKKCNLLSFDYKLLALLDVKRKRSELVIIFAKPRTTIYDSLVRLLKNNLIKKEKIQLNKFGRKTIFWSKI